MEKARAALQKELTFTKIIRSRRFVHMALKHLLDQSLRKKLKSQSQFQEINIEKAKSSQMDNKEGENDRSRTIDMTGDLSAVCPDADEL